MRAMSLTRSAPVQEAPLSLVSMEDPHPAPDELLVEVGACGVCRTDLHIVEGELAAPRLPLVPGHEVVGRVREAGAAVQGWSTGDRVGVAWVNRFCGVCEPCVEGHENLCVAPTFTGYHRNGGYADLVVVPAAFAHPIPEELGDDAAVAPLLCAGIIGYRALKRSGLRPGRRLALYGFGGSAHIAIQVAVAWGCEVFVVSRGQDARERALTLGASWVGAEGERPPRPVEHAVSFAPAGAVIPEALEVLAPGGTLALAGIYVDCIPELDYARHLFMERNLVSVTANTRADARELLRMAARLHFRTDIRTFDLEQANEALQLLRAGRVGAQAAVLSIARDRPVGGR